MPCLLQNSDLHQARSAHQTNPHPPPLASDQSSITYKILPLSYKCLCVLVTAHLCNHTPHPRTPSASKLACSLSLGSISGRWSLLIYLLTNFVMRLVWTKTWTKQMCDLNTFYHWSSCTLLCFGRRIHSVHSMKPIATQHKAFSDETNRSFMQAPQSRLKKKNKKKKNMTGEI